jgi:predicted nucleic acid-binding protein
VTVFVDTNVLVYARDAAQPGKQPVAGTWMDRLWATAEGRLSSQVLNEFYVTVTRKLRPGLSLAEARAEVMELMAWTPIPVTDDIVRHAWTIEDRFALSFWDALIVAAARAAGCRHLLTEDLQDGQDLDGVLVVDPFRHEPETVLEHS